MKLTPAQIEVIWLLLASYMREPDADRESAFFKECLALEEIFNELRLANPR